MPDILSSKFDQRVYFGLTPDKHATPCTYGENFLHCCLIGPNGCGKDTSIITPNLARLRRSVFLIDPKGEQAAIVYRHRARFSEMIVINPFGVLTDTHPCLKSHGFNCIGLPEFDPANDNFNSNARDVAKSLIKHDGGDSFFTTSGEALIAALVMGARIKYGPRANLKHVRDMLAEDYETEGGKPIGLFKTIAEFSELGHEAVRAKLAQFLTAQRSTIDAINTTRAQTEWTDDTLMAKDLAGEPFDFDQLKRELITVILILPADKLDSHATWLRLVLGSALRAMMRTPPGLQRPLLIINEAAQLGYMESLKAAHGIARGFGVQIMTVWQSLAQGFALYGKNFETILGARGVLSAFAPQDMETAEYLSKLCGYRTELITNYNAQPGQPNTERQDTPQGYPLYRPEDLMRLPKGTLINFFEGVEFPFLTNAPGYWELPWCSSLDPNPYYQPKRARPRRLTAWPDTTRRPGDRREALRKLQERRGE
jgi:type IV secretion system protein VirD4